MSQNNSESSVDSSKRTWIITSACAGVVGGVAAATPFVASFTPSEKAKAAGAPVEVDISELKPGEMQRAEWRGKPIWIMKRTPEQLASLSLVENQLADPDSLRKQASNDLMPSCRNQHRSIKPEIFVTVGICTHLGCSPSDKFTPGPQPSLPDDWHGGFLCPCHGSTFDLAGRVFKNKPAPDNLEVPIHEYVTDTKIRIFDPAS